MLIYSLHRTNCECDEVLSFFLGLVFFNGEWFTTKSDLFKIDLTFIFIMYAFREIHSSELNTMISYI